MITVSFFVLMIKASWGKAMKGTTGENRGIYLSQPYCIAYIAESERYLSSMHNRYNNN